MDMCFDFSRSTGADFRGPAFNENFNDFSFRLLVCYIVKKGLPMRFDRNEQRSSVPSHHLTKTCGACHRYPVRNVPVSIFVLARFPQHFMCVVIHALPQGWSMSGSMGRILCNNVAGDGRDVVSSLVQLSIPFRRLHTLAASAIYNANFPI